MSGNKPRYYALPWPRMVEQLVAECIKMDCIDPAAFLSGREKKFHRKSSSKQWIYADLWTLRLKLIFGRAFFARWQSLQEFELVRLPILDRDLQPLAVQLEKDGALKDRFVAMLILSFQCYYGDNFDYKENWDLLTKLKPFKIDGKEFVEAIKRMNKDKLGANPIDKNWCQEQFQESRSINEAYRGYFSEYDIAQKTVADIFGQMVQTCEQSSTSNPRFDQNVIHVALWYTVVYEFQRSENLPRNDGKL